LGFAVFAVFDFGVVFALGLGLGVGFFVAFAALRRAGAAAAAGVVEWTANITPSGSSA
jgi:hypothetical protein